MRLETGQIARQANGAVLASTPDRTGAVLATVMVMNYASSNGSLQVISSDLATHRSIPGAILSRMCCHSLAPMLRQCPMVRPNIDVRPGARAAVHRCAVYDSLLIVVAVAARSTRALFAASARSRATLT